MEIKLTIPEKILVHLYAYRKYTDRYEYPEEMTQQGIAKCIGISVTHVPRNMKKLIEEGLVEAKKGHVHGKKKRVTIYFLTPSGVIRAHDIIKNINSHQIEVEEKYLSIEDIRELTGKSLLEILRAIEKGEKIRLPHGKSVVFFEEDVKYEKFVDRKKELKEMEKWYNDGKILSIVGPSGIGKTVLVKEFLQRIEIFSGIVWLKLYDGRTWSSIRELFKELFGTEKILDSLQNSPTLLIFDNYHNVDDEFVEAMRALTMENIGDSRIIVTMPSSTPFYNRFYSIKDVEEGRVVEINLGPLSYEDARKILPHVKDIAFKRIYQLTNGNTRLLWMLSKGKLKPGEGVPLTPETVHLLNYLASQRE